MEHLEQDQARMKKDVNLMNGKADHILKSVIAMEREEGLQQGTTVRNVILVFPYTSQPTLINPMYGVPHRYYP